MQTKIDFTDSHVIATLSLFVFVVLFTINLFNLRKFRIPLPRIPIPRIPKFSRKGIFVAVGAFVTITALIMILFVFTSVYVTGVYYVIISSERNKQAAISEVQKINKLLIDIGENGLGLEARAYPSGEGNPWHAITVGGAHFSKKSAEQTLKRARLLLRDHVHTDAWISLYYPKEQK